MSSTTHSEQHTSKSRAPLDVPHVGANRRAERRFQVKGSTVRTPCRSFRICGAEIDVTRMFLGVVPWSSADGCDVLNISKGGLCFESTRPMLVGEQLELQLWIPGRAEPISLKGDVRWCKTGSIGVSTVGVQFAPFGTSRGRNSVEALDGLRQLESEHV